MNASLSRPNLDFLRSLAVSLVITDHALLFAGIRQIGPFSTTWLGGAGVYLFFVHTTAVLMWSLERNSGLLAFYVRRALRIYPLAIATLLAGIVLRLPFRG
jgi:peptidoglycan/LPS O-acetylase OafA/YrhL